MIAGLACDDDNDDNDTPADDDDSDDASPAGTWPDDPKPIVGWVATSRSAENEWGSLWQIADGQAVPVSAPDSSPFFFGDATVNHAWATDMYYLFSYSGNKWGIVAPEPPCAGDDTGFNFLKVELFGFSGAAISCSPTRTVLFWDNVDWKPTCTDCALYNCLESGACGVGLLNGFRKNLGIQTESAYQPLLTDVSLFPGHASFVLQSEEVAYALTLQTADMDWWQLTHCQNGTCRIDDRIEGTIDTRYPTFLVRIDDEHTAYSGYRMGGFGYGVVVLEGYAKLIETDWPCFRWLTFAPGGSGLGIVREEGDWVLYLITGMEITRLMEFPEGEYPTGFLVAADAY
ncbi:MAG: hypothetical protein P9L99_09085 [Candidatus Lernaella stagnicola]|nr:hypothetical protein [Candidatus Lernaella stagnicola]